jgi:two-component system chemotaxis response regulator CheB
MDALRVLRDDTAGPEDMNRGSSHDTVIVMATSAGGLKALKAVLSQLPPRFDAAIVILQHIAEGSPALLPEILRPIVAMPVAMVISGDRLCRGRVYVAPPDKHTVIRRGRFFKFEFSPPTHFVRPSADKLFVSAAKIYGRRTIGVILTGRGEDGTDGAHAIKAAGGTVICQDRESSLEFGMPGAAIVHGDADYIVALDAIAPLLTRLVREAAA